ncbi:hypothetical protein HK405_004359, partial [Cladochytrium tenue]
NVIFGDPQYRLDYTISGEPVLQIGQVLSAAAAGELAVHPTLWRSAAAAFPAFARTARVTVRDLPAATVLARKDPAVPVAAGVAAVVPPFLPPLMLPQSSSSVPSAAQVHQTGMPRPGPRRASVSPLLPPLKDHLGPAPAALPTPTLPPPLQPASPPEPRLSTNSRPSNSSQQQQQQQPRRRNGSLAVASLQTTAAAPTDAAAASDALVVFGSDSQALFQRFMNAALVCRLKMKGSAADASSHTSLHNELSEYRRMTILFLKLRFPFDFVRVQEAFSASLNCLRKYEGILQQFSSDDKGTSMLAVFGLPPFSHENETEFAIICAAAIKSALLERGLTPFTVALATGDTLFSVIPSPVRREAALLSDVVVTAARLMDLDDAVDCVVCDQATKLQTKPTHDWFELLGDYKLKGRREGLQVWNVVKVNLGCQEKKDAPNLEEFFFNGYGKEATPNHVLQSLVTQLFAIIARYPAMFNVSKNLNMGRTVRRGSLALPMQNKKRPTTSSIKTMPSLLDRRRSGSSAGQADPTNRRRSSAASNASSSGRSRPRLMSAPKHLLGLFPLIQVNAESNQSSIHSGTTKDNEQHGGPDVGSASRRVTSSESPARRHSLLPDSADSVRAGRAATGNAPKRTQEGAADAPVSPHYHAPAPAEVRASSRLLAHPEADERMHVLARSRSHGPGSASRGALKRSLSDFGLVLDDAAAPSRQQSCLRPDDAVVAASSESRSSSRSRLGGGLGGLLDPTLLSTDLMGLKASSVSLAVAGAPGATVAATSATSAGDDALRDVFSLSGAGEVKSDSVVEIMARFGELDQLPLLNFLPWAGFPETEASRRLGAAARTRLLHDLVARLVDRVATCFKLVLAFDACQWMDDLSADALRALLLAPKQKAFIVLASRPLSELSSGPLASLERMKTECTALSLNGFTEADVEDMMKFIVKPTPKFIQPEIIHAVFAKCSGHPFFSRMVITAMLDQSTGCLYTDPASGELRLVSEDAVDLLPVADIESAIMVRFDRLPGEYQTVVKTAAMLGQTFDLADLVGVLGDDHLPYDAICDLIARYDDHGFVVRLPADGLEGEAAAATGTSAVPALDGDEDGLPRFGFSNTVVMDAIVGSMSNAQRQALNERIAEYLECTLSESNLDALVPTITFHYMHSNNLVKTVEYMEALAILQFEKSMFTAGVDTIQHLTALVQAHLGELEDADPDCAPTDFRRAWWLTLVDFLRRPWPTSPTRLAAARTIEAALFRLRSWRPSRRRRSRRGDTFAVPYNVGGISDHNGRGADYDQVHGNAAADGGDDLSAALPSPESSRAEIARLELRVFTALAGVYASSNSLPEFGYAVFRRLNLVLESAAHHDLASALLGVSRWARLAGRPRASAAFFRTAARHSAALQRLRHYRPDLLNLESIAELLLHTGAAAAAALDAARVAVAESHKLLNRRTGPAAAIVGALLQQDGRFVQAAELFLRESEAILNSEDAGRKGESARLRWRNAPMV